MTHWRDSRGAAVSARISGPLILRPDDNRELRELDALIRAAQEARPAAARGRLAESPSYLALLNAMHELTEIDAIYEAARKAEWLQAPSEDESPSTVINREIADQRMGVRL